MEVKFQLKNDRTNFVTKTILKNNKKEVLETFRKSLIMSDVQTAYDCTLEILFSGYYDQYWEIIFMIIVEYINIVNPITIIKVYQKWKYFMKILAKAKKKNYKLINLRNLYAVQTIFLYCTKYVANSKKKHLSGQIRPSYNEAGKFPVSDVGIMTLLKNFRLYLSHLVNDNIVGNKLKTSTANSMYKILGNLFSINSNSTLIDNNIKLYHHTRGKYHNNISIAIWNSILTKAQGHEKIKQHIKILHDLYINKLLENKKKRIFFMLNSLLFLTRSTSMNEQFRLEAIDISMLEKFINETQRVCDGKVKPKKRTKVIHQSHVMDDMNIVDYDESSPTEKLKEVGELDNEDVITLEQPVKEKELTDDDIINCSFFKKGVAKEIDDPDVENNVLADYNRQLFDLEDIPEYQDKNIDDIPMKSLIPKSIKYKQKYNPDLSKYKISKSYISRRE